MHDFSAEIIKLAPLSTAEKSKVTVTKSACHGREHDAVKSSV